MAEKYHTALRDPELLSLKDEIASIDARLAELWQRVDSGESGELWEAVDKEWQALKHAQALNDVPKMHASFDKLDLLFQRQRTDTAAHREIAEKIEQRRKLVETEHKRLMTSQQVLNQTEAMVYMGAITDIITRNVTDKKALSQIVVELQQVMMKDQVPVYAEAQG
jgi:hypothetical protein